MDSSRNIPKGGQAKANSAASYGKTIHGDNSQANNNQGEARSGDKRVEESFPKQKNIQKTTAESQNANKNASSVTNSQESNRSDLASPYGLLSTSSSSSSSSSSSIRSTQSKEKSTSNDTTVENKSDIAATATADIVDDEDIFTPKPGYRLNWMADSGVPFEPQLEELTDKQRNNFYKFRDAFLKRFNECKDIDRNKFFQVPDDYTMLRFLKADDFNVDLASNRLINACIWRQKSGFDDFITNPNRKAYKFFLGIKSRHVLGVDKSQRPFIIEKLGQFLSNEHIIPMMPLQLWIMCFAYDIALGLQEFREVSIKYNRVIHQVDFINDLAGIKFFSAMKMMSFLSAMTKDVEMNFPEVVGVVSLVNPPGIIGTLWSIGKRFIDAKTLSRMSISYGPPTEFIEKYFGADIVPIDYGGTRAIKLRDVMTIEEAMKYAGLEGPITEEEMKQHNE